MKKNRQGFVTKYHFGSKTKGDKRRWRHNIYKNKMWRVDGHRRLPGQDV